jgi:hypothetical protein
MIFVKMAATTEELTGWTARRTETHTLALAVPWATWRR